MATERQIIFPLERTIFHLNKRLFSLFQKSRHIKNYRNGRLYIQGKFLNTFSNDYNLKTIHFAVKTDGSGQYRVAR